MFEHSNAEESNDTLWVLAKIKNSVCALDGRHVESIQLLDEPIRPLPGSDDVHVGVLKYRGNIIEAIDLRRMMGFPSLAEEQREFEQMLEQRKQDHIHWVDALAESVHTNTPFGLATDPHKCAFGKWYDHYETDNQAVRFHLNKIAEPHRMLHATAHEALACQQLHDQCTRKVCIKEALQHASDEYMPLVVSLLEETKAVFQAGSRKMAVVLSDGICTRAILVDEVLSADTLDSLVENKGVFGEAEDCSLVSHIAQSSALGKQILVLNVSRLFESEAVFA